MPSELFYKTQSLWSGILAIIDNDMVSGGLLEGLKTFVPHRRIRGGQAQHPAMYVLSKTTEISEWGTNRSVGSLIVNFGVTQSTVRPGDAIPVLEEVAFNLATVFLNDPTVYGIPFDTKIESIASDSEPFGPEDTELWVTVSIRWLFEFVHV